MAPTIQYRKTVYLTEELSQQWDKYQAEHGDESFNSVVLTLIKEFLCVTNAPTSTIPSGM